MSTGPKVSWAAVRVVKSRMEKGEARVGCIFSSRRERSKSDWTKRMKVDPIPEGLLKRMLQCPSRTVEQLQVRCRE